MVNPNRFYTYAYLREDRTPYYIGKGCGRRAYCKCKKQFQPPKDKSRIIFLKQNLTEKEAFKHEKYMITVLGRKDLGTGILHNKTDGGEGVSGLKASPELKKRRRELRYGKTHSQETRKKISDAKRGKPHSQETRKKISEAKKNKTSQETKNKMSESKAKSFSVISPTGEIIHSKNAQKFCIDNHLSLGNFCAVLRGERQMHKGFRLYSK